MVVHYLLIGSLIENREMIFKEEQKKVKRRAKMAVIIYWIIAYWAVPKTIWANKVLIGVGNEIFLRRVALALILGWLLIPWAIIKMLVDK